MWERKNFCASYLTKFSIGLSGIWYSVETCWSDEPHTHHPCFISSILYWRERTLPMWFCGKNVHIVWYSDIYVPISLKFGIIIETTNLHILISVWLTLTSMQGHSCMRNQNFDAPFLANLCVNLDEIRYIESLKAVSFTCLYSDLIIPLLPPYPINL